MIIYNGKYSVYVHINRINGKMYIGITKQRVEERWRRGSTYKGNTHFYAAIKTYGWDNFEHEVFAANLTEAEAKNMEKLLISKFETQNRKYGYNVTGGGDTPITHSDEVRRKISEAVSGEKHPCFGKRLSEETCRRISIAGKGVKKPMIADMKSIPVICVETGQWFPSAKIASEQTGVPRTGIVFALKGTRERSGGYHWKYANKTKEQIA